MMNKEETQGIIDSIYPVGKLRWFQIEILEQDKAIKNLPWGETNKEELGFKVQAIACVDQFQPQVSALLDLKDELVTELINLRSEFGHDTAISYVMNRMLDSIRDKFNMKIDEITKRTIKNINTDTNEQS